MTPKVLAITSDHHALSTVALCPDRAIKLDDGGEYMPSKVQRWIWQHWLLYWDRVARVRDEKGAELYNIYNGDLVDGDHHGTSQLVSRNPVTQFDIVQQCLSVPQKLEPDYNFVIRGTEAHTGKSANFEESIARWLGAEVDPATGQSSWWRLRMELGGYRLDLLHHGRTGYRPWTRHNASLMLAAEIMLEYDRSREPWPDLAIRSHRHVASDSYDAFPTRVIQTPAWQLSTAYCYKVVPESLPDIGGIIVVIEDSGITVEKVIAQPSRGSVWKIESK